MSKPADERTGQSARELHNSASGAVSDTPTSSFTVAPIPFSDITPHARGGLGEVLRASDPVLNRIVAIKRLRSDRAGDPDGQRRFLFEAEVTARLEHPGIVPVYGLYPDAACGAAYAMRFVEGRTLAEEIASHHDSSPDPSSFRRLMQAFLQVCQTVAYAHSRGVIHRDLKPANVMLGKFGETLVVDWGLAKIVGRPELVRISGMGETLVASVPEYESGETAMGSAAGTPGYMSPEQAAGRWDVVAQASDIYGLGAVFYTLLTGKPPLERENWPLTQQRIQQGDFPRPRQLNSNIPRSLESVCLKAMALKPEDRYDSAESLGLDVDRWLADEPVTAYPEPMSARIRRWGMKRRGLVGTSAVLLVLAVVGLSIGAGLLDRARVETDDQRKTALTAQRKAEAINRFLIDDLLKQADPVNNPVGDKVTVRQLLDRAAERLGEQTSLSEQPEVEAEIRAVIGHAYEYLGLNDQAEPHYRRAWELLGGALGRERPETLALRNRLVCAVVNGGRLALAETQARDALDTCLRVLGEQHPTTADAANNFGQLRMHQGKLTEAISLHEQACRIARALNGRDDDKKLEYDNNLAVTLVMAGRPEEAMPLLQSVAERRRMLNCRDPEFAVALGNLGGALVALGRFQDAEPVLREAVDGHVQARGAKARSTLATRNLLCYALEGQERWADAERDYLAVLLDRRSVEGTQNALGVQRSLAYMARLYAKQNRWGDSANCLAELMSLKRPRSERASVDTSAALKAALVGMSDLVKAEPLLKECLESLTAPLWTGDWLIAEISSRHGDNLRRQGKLKESESILVNAGTDAKKAVGVPAWGNAAVQKRIADWELDAKKSAKSSD